MKQHTSIHWVAPVSMLGGLAAGVLFAGGHHLFYSSLDGKPVSNGFLLGSTISKQELNVSIGLAFAFLVKSCLVFSMSVAFVQLFWREAKAPNPRHVPTLARLDSLHSVFNNILALVDVRLWLRSPLPFMIAALAWLVTSRISLIWRAERRLGLYRLPQSFRLQHSLFAWLQSLQHLNLKCVSRIWTLEASISLLQCRISRLSRIRATCLRTSTMVRARQYWKSRTQ